MDDRAVIRSRIKSALRRAPGWISGASVQRVREFKKFHANSVKLADKSTASAAVLLSLESQIIDMYQ